MEKKTKPTSDDDDVLAVVANLTDSSRAVPFGHDMLIAADRSLRVRTGSPCASTRF